MFTVATENTHEQEYAPIIIVLENLKLITCRVVHSWDSWTAARWCAQPRAHVLVI
jgi:hypothetical protein